MARYRRMGSLRPVNRIKHIVDAQGTVAKNVVLPVNLIKSTDTPVLANTNECETGSRVNGVYLKVEIASNDVFDAGVVPNCYLSIVKNPGGNITTPFGVGIGANDNKRFVIHQEMIMINNVQGGNPRVLFNGVIAIPKGYRRNGPNDLLVLNIVTPQLDTAVCVQCHYKEFR